MVIERRAFLGMLAAGAAAPGFSRFSAVQAGEPGPAAGAVVKIDRIEVFAARYPMTGYFKFFTGPHGSAGRAAVFVKVTADDGTIGWGQSVPIAKWSYETLETVELALREYYAPVLIGRNPADIAGAHTAMDGAIAPGFSTGMPIARAGIDIALHDLVGKLRGQSLAEMWGLPTDGELTLSWTVNVRTIADVERVVGAGRERGYEHFNIKVAPDPEFDAALAREVRRFAPDCFLWADANGGYAPDTALRAAPRLADAGVDVLEAPLRPNRISGYQALKKQAALPILMDEGVIGPVELEEFHRLGMIDGVAMKPARCGGLTSNHAQIEYCKEHDLIWLGSGLTDPDISFAATIGLYAAHGLTKPAALNGPQFLTADVLVEPLLPKAGRIAAPTGPGLGIEVNEARVRELAKRARAGLDANE
jgi:L-alanine-DL-glutamate epimerase-like enolase superfamily enzyme